MCHALGSARYSEGERGYGHTPCPHWAVHVLCDIGTGADTSTSVTCAVTGEMHGALEAQKRGNLKPCARKEVKEGFLEEMVP